MTQNAYLVHHGVKGMKWGVRKDKPTTSSEGANTKPRKKTVARKIAVGAAATAGVLALYGLSRASSPKVSAHASSGQDWFSAVVAKNTANNKAKAAAKKKAMRGMSPTVLKNLQANGIDLLEFEGKKLSR